MLVRNPQQLQILRDNGKIHQEVFATIKQQVLGVGNTGMQAEQIAKDILAKHGASSAFLGAYGYPANIIVSINDTVVHGVPTHEPYKDGDVVTIDFGVKKHKLLTDAAFTVIIGKPKRPQDVEIIQAARDALHLGIAQAKTGNTTGDIGSAIWDEITSRGFHIVKDLTGHGLGTSIHEKPNIFNYGKAGRGFVLGDGQYIAIEPIVGMSSGEIYDTDHFSINME